MRVPGGVTVQGEGPQLTILDGHGLNTAVTFSSSDAAHPSTLRDLTVKGAATGVATGQGSHVVLQNIIVSDNTAFGIDVGASGVATAISVTLYKNGVAARSFGTMAIRNSIIAANRRGLVAAPAEALLSRYNDLFDNQEVAYDNVVAGKGDLARKVSIQDADTGDVRVANDSPTTDHGDPTDDFAREPAPNGGRINLGAFAGTERAELSPAPGSSVASKAVGGATPVGAPAPVLEPTINSHRASGGGGCALAPAPVGGPYKLGRDVVLGAAGLGLALGMATRRRARRITRRR